MKIMTTVSTINWWWNEKKRVLRDTSKWVFHKIWNVILSQALVLISISRKKNLFDVISAVIDLLRKGMWPHIFNFTMGWDIVVTLKIAILSLRMHQHWRYINLFTQVDLYFYFYHFQALTRLHSLFKAWSRTNVTYATSRFDRRQLYRNIWEFTPVRKILTKKISYKEKNPTTVRCVITRFDNKPCWINI